MNLENIRSEFHKLQKKHRKAGIFNLYYIWQEANRCSKEVCKPCPALAKIDFLESVSALRRHVLLRFTAKVVVGMLSIIDAKPCCDEDAPETWEKDGDDPAVDQQQQQQQEEEEEEVVVVRGDEESVIEEAADGEGGSENPSAKTQPQHARNNSKETSKTKNRQKGGSGSSNQKKGKPSKQNHKQKHKKK